jgi:hypothetical protein
VVALRIESGEVAGREYGTNRKNGTDGRVFKNFSVCSVLP